MRILIIANEVWNDKIHGNNVLTNWFSGFPAEIYMISCSPGQMINNVCKNYFQITDSMMLKSIFSKKKAGITIKYKDYPTEYNVTEKYAPMNKRLYTFLKKITTEFLRNIREFIWMHGKYDEKKLNEFLDEANPDIIFTGRYASAKLLRLEKYVKDYTKKPIIAYTGDNECAIGEKFGVNLFKRYRINKVRKMMDKQIPEYSLYYTHSSEQKKEYNTKYGIPTKVLQKCGDFREELIHKDSHKPIKIIYAGKLYCERWKTLAEIGKALKVINREKVLMTLNIYTQDKISQKQREVLNDGRNIFINSAVSPDELKQLYKDYDIVLHVESFNNYYRTITRYSFSTKIIDCLASGCAVMSICSSEQAGFKYLKEQNAAITIDNISNIIKELNNIIYNPELIYKYAAV